MLKLTKSLHRPGGRNNQGHATSRYQGGGHKRRYRMIDFQRDKTGIPAKVAAIEYDPNRSARIALLHYADGEKRYILAPLGAEGRRHAHVGPGRRHRDGQRLPLRNVPLGTSVHNDRAAPRHGRPGRARRPARCAS